jgi:RimJ/RimL family protein N-acetyltransferase
MLDRIERHFADHGWGLWALEERQGGRLIGLCGLQTLGSDMPFAPGVEIGWRLSTGWQGKGLAREAADAALRFGFETLRLGRIVAFTVPANRASWGLMQRLGMREIGGFEHPKLPEGHPLRHHLLFALDDPESVGP